LNKNNPCFYTVVRYVPDPLAEEFVNIAVLVFTDDHAQCEVKDLEDALTFGTYADQECLEDFCSRLKSGCEANDLSLIEPPNLGSRIQAIRHTAHAWMNSIQLRTPCASIASIEDTIKDVERIFLSERSLS
jgi:Protein of unknown function (DUF3037)